jgi:hypothetical protein
MWCTVPRAKVATGMVREVTLECANLPYVTLDPARCFDCPVDPAPAEQ